MLMSKEHKNGDDFFMRAAATEGESKASATSDGCCGSTHTQSMP
ncbi:MULTISPECIES: hypothetical protein [unclassified Lysobacter]|nr:MULTISPECIES: hypothetical protein [unclassified Lysobacter]